MLKFPLIFFSSLWVLCSIFLFFHLFSLSKEDQLQYQKQITAILKNSKDLQNEPVVQYKKNVSKEFFSEKASGKLTAKRARLYFDPLKKIFQEKLLLINGYIKQDEGLTKIRAEKGLYDYKAQSLTLFDVTTTVYYETEKNKQANISSFSKKATFYLDAKNPSFDLEKTKGHCNL